MVAIPPSEAVRVIDRMFPFASDVNANPELDVSSSQKLASILAIVDQIPSALVIVNGEALAVFTEGRATIRTFLKASHVQGVHARPLAGRQVRALREILSRCPAHAAPATVATLGFIQQQDLREGLRADIASVETSIREADWKPATVIAGSV